MCMHYYFEHKNTYSNVLSVGCKNSEMSDFCFVAPTQSLLQKWLRDKHNIHIMVEFIEYKRDLLVYKATYQCMKLLEEHENMSCITGWCDTDYSYKTYEEALEASLQEALTQI